MYIIYICIHVYMTYVLVYIYIYVCVYVYVIYFYIYIFDICDIYIYVYICIYVMITQLENLLSRIFSQLLGEMILQVVFQGSGFLSCVFQDCVCPN